MSRSTARRKITAGKRPSNLNGDRTAFVLSQLLHRRLLVDVFDLFLALPHGLEAARALGLHCRLQCLARLGQRRQRFTREGPGCWPLGHCIGPIGCGGLGAGEARAVAASVLVARPPDKVAIGRLWVGALATHAGAAAPEAAEAAWAVR